MRAELFHLGVETSAVNTEKLAAFVATLLCCFIFAVPAQAGRHGLTNALAYALQLPVDKSMGGNENVIFFVYFEIARSHDIRLEIELGCTKSGLICWFKFLAVDEIVHKPRIAGFSGAKFES